MKKSKKILIGIISLLALFIISKVVYFLVHYQFYDKYKDYLSSYDVEEGTEFTPISESASSVAGYKLAAENDFLKLYVDTETAYVAIYDKRNGQVVYSNPEDADDDEIANVTHKNYLKSQLIINYFNTQRNESTMDSYSYCTSLGQLDVEGIQNGIRFIYHIGDLTASTGIVPIYISEDTLNDVVSKLPDDEAKFVLKKFKESSVAEGYMEMLESAQGGASQLRKLNKYFEEAGFTQEDYNREMENSGVEGAIPVSFDIPLEYRLNGDAVDVSIPMSAVHENGGGFLYTVQFLRYFGASGTQEDGYLLVPNGSGSIINFNNGKSTAAAYSDYIYGVDPVVADFTVMENTENTKMALFGIFRKNSSVFATIEKGASLGNITAYVSGKFNSYNYVYTTFYLRGHDTLAMFGTTGAEAELPIIEPECANVNITVKYTMLTDEYSGYAGAANYYRERLVNEGALTKNNASEDIKFYYDILGGVEKTKYFMGVRYRGLYAMTTFDEAEDISNDLAKLGITNQVMNYQGWSKGGYYMDALTKVKIPYKLGGKRGLEDLSDALAKNGGTLYVDASFQKVSSVADNYNVSRESAKYYGSGYVVELGMVNPDTLRSTSSLGFEENIYYLISPKFLTRHVEKFAKKIEKIDVAGISLRDLGNELHSDKKRTNIITREQALEVVNAELQNLVDTGKKIMVNDGNDYSFAYADDIINVPLTDNDYYIVDETVPFYEMILHGYVDYAGSLINIDSCYNPESMVLELIRNGASPHFVFSKESSSKIKDTGLSFYYATTYENWKQDALDIYNQVNDALCHVTDAAMVNYEILGDGLVATTYSNGVVIYVNEGTTDRTVNGVNVPARSYGIGGVQ